jgi:energy-converting hydrogenase Eha subunit C
VRWLNFPALVIGSLVPDAAYVFAGEEISTFSHQILGSIAFGFPVGLLMLAVFHFFRVTAVEMLPNPGRQLFLTLCYRPIGPLWLAAASLIIGIWTHVLWDSFTHNGGWIVGHLSILQTPVFIFAGRTARVCHVLWYASSFAGVGWIVIAFEKWKWTHEPGMNRIPVRSLIMFALLLSTLFVPVALVRHLVRGQIGFILTAVLCTLLVIVFAIRMTRTRRSMRL